MKVIVVTGGIGSGKSSVCRILENEFGWPVYDADRRVKELYVSSHTLLDSVEAALGRTFRDDNGSFVARSLASVIFSDPDALDIVESLVFPELQSDFAQWKAGFSDKRFVVLESATVLQKPQLNGMGDIVVIVDAPMDVRARRAAVRDGVSDEAIRLRMSAQGLMNDISEGKAKSAADFLVLNDGTEKDLELKVRHLVENIGKQKC